jgi:phenylacetate-coenzyme A ligase PaaK-like adenylate-forming protein
MDISKQEGGTAAMSGLPSVESQANESTSWHPSGLTDQSIDTCSSADFQAFAVAAFRRQSAFAVANTAFWAHRLNKFGAELERIETLKDLSLLPVMIKSEHRQLSPWELVPRISRDRLHLCRSTSGTTGTPTSSFWTLADLRAIAQTIVRLLKMQRPPMPIVALNGYHQGHLAAVMYDDVIRLLGGVTVPRHHSQDDESATLERIKEFGCNTLILAHPSGQAKKGRTVEDLLKYDPQFFANCGIRWWIGSSDTFTSAIRAEAMRQGVLSVSNLYGSSDLGFLAVSCIVHPDEFHLALGHALIEITDGNGVPVGHGDRGRIVATRLFSCDESGGTGPHQGSQFIRFWNGDEALFLANECECGIRRPRIKDIRKAPS